MLLVQTGFPDTGVRTLDSAGKIIMRRFQKGGPRIGNVNDKANERYYIVEVTTCSREWKRKRH